MTNESEPVVGAVQSPLAIRRCKDPSCWCRNPKWTGDVRGIPMSYRKMYLVNQEKQSNGNKETDIGK